jgi:hypothetical protein
LFVNLLTQIDEPVSVLTFFEAIEDFVKRLKERAIKKKSINEKMFLQLDINDFNTANELIDHLFSE